MCHGKTGDPKARPQNHFRIGLSRGVSFLKVLRSGQTEITDGSFLSKEALPGTISIARLGKCLFLQLNTLKSLERFGEVSLAFDNKQADFWF